MRTKSINITSMGAACLFLCTVSMDALASPVSVPEPSILGLLGIGVAVMIIARIKRK